MKRTIFTALLMMLAIGCERDHANSVGPGTGEYELVWSDEFDGPLDQLPEQTNWTWDIGNGAWGWGNNQLEYDTNLPENASLDGEGMLRITAREESYQGFDYTSARILTRDRIEIQYGRVEARIKLPVGQGIWPAFWMLGENIDSAGWPQCGEIDIMEYRGQTPGVILGTLHGPGYSGGGGITNLVNITPESFHEDFHVFAIEWQSDRIDWFLDDELYHRVYREQVPGAWVFDQPFFIILNIAVGGTFVGAPDESTVFPQTMLVDWVRVHQKD
jgi:beta-glucanase (GH16 family)